MPDGSKQIAEDVVQEIVSDCNESDHLFTSHSSMDDHTYVSRYQENSDQYNLDEFMKIRSKSESPTFDGSLSDPGYESISASPPRTDVFNYDECINWELFPNLN